EPLVFGAGALERLRIARAEAGRLDLVRHVGAEVRRQGLPLDGEEPVALEVAERAVVGDDLEPVPKRLEAAAGPVAAGLARPDERRQALGAAPGRQARDGVEHGSLAERRRLEEEGGEQLLLAALHAEEPHRR